MEGRETLVDQPYQSNHWYDNNADIDGLSDKVINSMVDCIALLFNCVDDSMFRSL